MTTINIQSFYKPLNQGVTEMLKYDSIILTRGDETTVTALRNGGFTAPIHEYVSGSAIQKTTGTPNKNQVAWNVGDWTSISTNHPDWFLYDTAGNKCPQIIGSTYYMMDPANTGWQQFFIDRINAWQSGGGSGYSGIFMDNIEGSLVKRTQQGQTLAKYTTDTQYQNAVKSFITAVQAGIGPGKVLGNIVSVHGNAWADYIAILDGAMSEATFVDFHDGYLTVAQWLSDITGLVTNGKEVILVCQSQTKDTPSSPRQTFCFGSYLLVAGPGVSFRYGYAGNSQYLESWWYDNYDIAIGDPVGAYTVNNGIYSRTYTNGSVSVDPAAHTATITVSTNTTFAIDSASVAVTGSPVTLRSKVKMAWPLTGAYVVTPKTVSFTNGIASTLKVDSIQFLVNGSDVSLLLSEKMNWPSGAFTVNGKTVFFSVVTPNPIHDVIVIDPVVVDVTGQDLAMTIGPSRPVHSKKNFVSAGREKNFIASGGNLA